MSGQFREAGGCGATSLRAVSKPALSFREQSMLHPKEA